MAEDGKGKLLEKHNNREQVGQLVSCCMACVTLAGSTRSILEVQGPLGRAELCPYVWSQECCLMRMPVLVLLVSG